MNDSKKSKLTLIEKYNKLKNILLKKKVPTKKYIKVGDTNYELTDSLYTMLINGLSSRNVLSKILTENGIIEIKSNLDPKTEYETISHILSLILLIVGQYAAFNEKTEEMWNENVGRKLSIQGLLIEKIAEYGKYEMASKMSINHIKRVLDYNKALEEQYSQNKMIG